MRAFGIPKTPGRIPAPPSARFAASAARPWLFSPEWPELIHPFASAIDTPLPTPPERTHLMLDFKAPWVEVESGRRDKRFARYPQESIAEWHQRLGLVSRR